MPRASRIRLVAPNPGATIELGTSGRSGVGPRVDPLLDIAEAAKAGDNRAVRELILRMRGSTRRIVKNVVHNSDCDVDDVTQEAEIAFISSLKNFRGESSVAHFLNNVTFRVALYARRRMKHGKYARAGASLEIPSDVDPHTPLSIIIDRRVREAVSRTLDELPEKIAEALILQVIFDYSTPEVAKTLQVNKSTVRSYLLTAKKEMRRLLRRERRIGHVT